MKKLVGVGVLAASLLKPGISEAEGYATSFDFRVLIDGQAMTYNGDFSQDESVIMPTYAWTCARMRVTVTNGSYLGGFTCTSGGTTSVSVMVACAVGKPDADHSAMILGYGNKVMTLVATCTTKPKTPARPVVPSGTTL